MFIDATVYTWQYLHTLQKYDNEQLQKKNY